MHSTASSRRGPAWGSWAPADAFVAVPWFYPNQAEAGAPTGSGSRPRPLPTTPLSVLMSTGGGGCLGSRARQTGAAAAPSCWPAPGASAPSPPPGLQLWTLFLKNEGLNNPDVKANLECWLVIFLRRNSISMCVCVRVRYV